MMSALFIIFQICFVFLSKTRCEDYNLYGDAGQAYAIEAYLGHPHQKLKLLVDTGSTTMAVASYPRGDNKEYFHVDNSTSVLDSQEIVSGIYSQGQWSGRLVTDYIHFPSLPAIREVRSDIAVITESHKFFMNGSGWQGLLGLAYKPLGDFGDGVAAESWLDAVDHEMNKPMSFQLKLCGACSPSNTTHYGHFKMLDDSTYNSFNKTFRTPILRKRWYEIAVISVRVIADSKLNQVVSNHKPLDLDYDGCKKLNAEKSIVDSGTTNIRLPDALYRRVVDELKDVYRSSQVFILDDFWYHGQAACWPEPQKWTLPWLEIDLLSADADNQYFTLEIPPQNYMRVAGVFNNSDKKGTVSEYCYTLGLESGGAGTVIGYTAMEGFQVLFNRSAGWIGWQTSDCGPPVRISGPYNSSTSLRRSCQLLRPVSNVAMSIRAAQWALCAVSIIATAVLIYLLAPCVKLFFVRRMPSSQQISLSQAALVEQEAT